LRAGEEEIALGVHVERSEIADGNAERAESRQRAGAGHVGNDEELIAETAGGNVLKGDGAGLTVNEGAGRGDLTGRPRGDRRRVGLGSLRRYGGERGGGCLRQRVGKSRLGRGNGKCDGRISPERNDAETEKENRERGDGFGGELHGGERRRGR
jgi:hypothetical protein